MHTKPNILVVDDEESIRFTFEIFLTEEGYAVTTAEDYAVGLDCLDRQPFDLVIADIILGGKTGLDLVRELRSRGHDCKVVVITGDPTGEIAVDTLRHGVQCCLPKPVCKDKLLEVTRSLVGPGSP